MDKEEKAKKVDNSKIQTQIESVDVVKMKLKVARDKIKTFINRKNNDIAQIDMQIK